ncbi:MAG: glycoside hydrolase family 78 protein [Bacteroidota bacterium]
MKSLRIKFQLFISLNLFALAWIWASPVMLAKPVTVNSMTCEYMENPVGIGTTVPRFSWILSSEISAQKQTSYQVLVASSPSLLKEKKADLWSSGKINSDQSVLVMYKGKALKSRDRCWWKVRVWDKNGKSSDWSETAYFEMGLLEQSDWKASWIGAPMEGNVEEQASPVFRKEFSAEKEISSARLYISGLGLYEAEINGSKVGDQLLTPGWTSYHSRVQYQTFDVTGQLRKGENALGVTLANGWYRGFRQWWSGSEQTTPEMLGVMAQLELTYSDGSIEVVKTDPEWKYSSGPILASSIYNGENYDARLENKGWSSPGFDESSWKQAVELPPLSIQVVSPASPPMRARNVLEPQKIFITPEGDTVLDMGQNMVGWIRLNIEAPRGTVITLRHAEVLDKEGNFYTDNLRRAKQTNVYICKGEGSESWEPRFTFQGFRYVAVSGIPGPIEKEMITGVVVHSDLDKTGDFSCNNELINQLQQNIVWGQKGNFVDVPTDCPQRDERLGWTGDAQVFAPTAIFNMDCAGFYTKWLADLALDQADDGAVPWVIPSVLGRGEAHGWADAATIVPWTVYRYYGDIRILESQYESMKGWVEYQAGQAGDTYLWTPKERQFGDWLAFATTRSDYPGATTDKDLLASAYFYHSTDLLQRTAEILGKKADAVRYSDLMKKIKMAFAEEFITPKGRLSSNTQTAYVVTLSFGLIPESLESSAAKRLADDVNSFGHLTTGFLGTPDLTHMLSHYGYLDEAYMLVFRKEYPSWLYPVTQGATTIWERWDGQKPDGSFQDVGMNSFNHYAYGAIGDWLYRKVAGIDLDPEVPGYKSMVIKPHPGSEMNDVKASHQTPYGKVISEWERSEGMFTLKVRIPVNATARICIPSSGGELSVDGQIVQKVTKEQGPGYEYLVVEKGSGTYTFESRLALKEAKKTR